MSHKGGQSLYVAREKIHPRAVSGFFQQLRTTTLWLAMSFFFILPWYQWHGQQAVLFDLPKRQFRIFAITFWPQDFYLLSWLMIIAAVSLLFVTMIAGRIWCGYACPQTAWTRLFIWVEKIVEGNRNQRIRLDKQSFGIKKMYLRVSKHVLWLLISLATAFTFVGYFTSIPVLQQDFLNLRAGGWEAFWIAFFTLATYVNAGWMREQVCLYLCPYARFQGSMFDKDSLIIAYNVARGEPRGARSRKETRQESALGDCVNCQLCVQVCPTGIDIREGLQIGCIGCAACIDACDAVMDKMQYAKKLISYTTENAQAGHAIRYLRPRVIATGILLLLLLSAFVWALSTRIPLSISVMRDRGALYRESIDGGIINAYRVKIINMSQETKLFDLSVSGLSHPLWKGKKAIPLHPGEQEIVAVNIQAAAHTLKNSKQPIQFCVTERLNPKAQVCEENRFFAPTPGGKR